MSYRSMFKKIEEGEAESLNENSDAVDKLRSDGFKIKLVTPTAFGTQIDFAKKYSDEDISKSLEKYDFKIKNNSVFVSE